MESGQLTNVLLYLAMVTIVVSLLAAGYQIAKVARVGPPRLGRRALTLRGARWLPFATLLVSVVAAFGLRASLEARAVEELNACLATSVPVRPSASESVLTTAVA